MARTVSPAELRALAQTLSDRRWHSGAALARAAGLTRAGLAKRVGKLAELGLDIESRPGRGVRLRQPLALLEADQIVGLLPPALRGRVAVQVCFSTDSTNRRLMEADAAADPQCLLAEHQTAGRGRRGRAWHSPLGANLYLSLAWSFARWPPQLPALSLAAGVASAAALRACGAGRVRLKWPNDLWLDGRKLGGLLIEQRGETGGSCRVVVGLGLNVHMQAAPAIDRPWISLRQAFGARTPARDVLAARVIEKWVGMLERFAADGFAPFAASWDKLDLTRGKPVGVQDGSRVFSGIAHGVDGEGALLVEAGGERHRLLSGDVSLHPAPAAEVTA